MQSRNPGRQDKTPSTATSCNRIYRSNAETSAPTRRAPLRRGNRSPSPPPPQPLHLAPPV